jgi:DNA helicase INO80
VQDIVVGNKNLTDVTKPSEIVQLLLNDEQLASLESSNRLSDGQDGDKQKQAAVRDMWNDDGDEFFGHTTGGDRQDENIAPAPSQTVRGKGRKSAASTRGRKPGPKKKGGTNAATFDD